MKKRALLLLLISMTTTVFSQDIASLGMHFPEPTRFLTAHGREAWAGGYARSGLEIWTGALQIADSVRPEFRRSGDVSIIPGAEIVSRIDSEPSHVSRTYTGPDFSVDEEIWVPLDRPAVLIRYRVRSTHPVQVTVRLHPSLNLMWPAAMGGQEIRWDEKHSGYILTDSARQFAAVVLAPGSSAHDEPLNIARLASDELAIALNGDSPEILFAQINPVAGNSSEWDAQVEGATKLLQSAGWEQEAVKHYQELTASGLRIETPDGELNRALVWAEIALDQDWFCNAKLGCGYVGGFGPSRRNRRPQYAWYFAGDGMIALHGAIASGDLERARKELEFITKYQDVQTGMIWHELSQSAPYLDWKGKYPYMFVHADLTYPYISSLADYLRASNDRAFLRETWPSLMKAFEYGRSMIANDGLPRIPQGKEGSDEQDPLSEELGLSVSWIQACSDYAHLAELNGDAKAAAEARGLADKARTAFAKRYWDPQRNSAIEGFHRTGAPVTDRGLSAMGAVTAHLFTGTQTVTVLDLIATSNFQTDWGTRSVGMSEPGFNPTAYAHGSVWAFGTESVAQTYWAEHRPDTAWGIWRTLIPWSELDSPGHMHEVLAGDTYHPQFESVPEQTWSSAGFLSSAVHGLLGLDVDAENGKITLAPHMPGDWDNLAVRGVKLGNSALDFELKRTQDGLTLHIANTGGKVHLVFRPELPLGAQVIRARMDGRHLPVTVEAHQQDQHALMEFDVAHGELKVEVQYRDGVSIVMPQPDPQIGDQSKGMKLKGIVLNAHQLEIGLDVMPGQQNVFRIRTQRTIRDATGVKASQSGTGEYECVVETGAGSAGRYQHKRVLISFQK